MRKLALLTIFALGLGIAACNTVAGAGQDVSAAGNAVTDTAHDASH
jgi:predicted small secreted protein